MLLKFGMSQKNLGLTQRPNSILYIMNKIFLLIRKINRAIHAQQRLALDWCKGLPFIGLAVQNLPAHSTSQASFLSAIRKAPQKARESPNVPPWPWRSISDVTTSTACRAEVDLSNSSLKIGTRKRLTQASNATTQSFKSSLLQFWHKYIKQVWNKFWIIQYKWCFLPISNIDKT